MTRVLVISKRHMLLPFANRLSKHPGVDIETIVSKTNYEAAWEGKFGKVLRGKDKARENLQPVVDAARSGQLIVLTDDDYWTEQFSGSPGLLGTLSWGNTPHLEARLVIGAWVQRNREPALRHAMLLDYGAWPGGQGYQQVPAAGVLVRPSNWPEAFENALRGEISNLPEGEVGLVGLFALPGDSGGLDILGAWGGWPFLHSHGFWSEISPEGMLKIFEGEEKLPALLAGPRFTVLSPVSIPPWPIRCNHPSGEVEVSIQPAAAASQVLFHDIRVEEKKLRSAGLDGLIGVARGSSQVLGAARTRALQVASAIQVGRERQIRPDPGLGAELLLGILEQLGMPLV